MDNIRYGGYWYAASILGFLGTMLDRVNFYFFFDDMFIFSTCISLFYSWQTYTDDTLTIREILGDAMNLRKRINEYIEAKKHEKEQFERLQIRKVELRKSLDLLDYTSFTFENPFI